MATDWRWQKLGGAWHLLWQDAGHTVALTAGLLADSDLTSVLLVRDETGRLVPLSPAHPAARLIEAAPALLAALEAVLAECDPSRGEDWYLDISTPALGQAKAAVASAKGKESTRAT